MARARAESNFKNNTRQPPVSEDQAKRPQGIKKQRALRKSLRIQETGQSHQQPLYKNKQTHETQVPVSPPVSLNPSILCKPLAPPRKRKRAVEQSCPPNQDQTSPRRLRTKLSRCTTEKGLHLEHKKNTSEESSDPLQYWIQTGRWPKEYFEQDSQAREDFEKGKSPEERGKRYWFQEYYTREPFQAMQAFAHLHHLFARKKSSASLRRKQSQSSLQTSSDQLPREAKSAQYRNPNYVVELEGEGSYMYKSTLGITDISRELCRTLLAKEQTIPQDTLFRDDLFEETCRKIQDRNEAMVIRDIGLLIVPSAQTLATYGATHLDHLYETTNEGWDSIFSFPLQKTRPQPDFSVGFGPSAFTQEQRNKLKPFVGQPGSKVLTYFMATTRMYFPFFTCEVKCGAAALNIADRQNAHSMTVAVRALIELFRSVKREKELDREILTFSISHDHSSVRIYGHYPVIEGAKTTFYRYTIHKFDFTGLDGKEKWTSLRFTKNLYDHYSPKLHKLICSAINDLPVGISFDLSRSASFSQSTPQSSRQSNAGSMLDEDDSQLSFLASEQVTPTTSVTKTTEPPTKKPKNQRAARQ